MHFIISFSISSIHTAVSSDVYFYGYKCDSVNMGMRDISKMHCLFMCLFMPQVDKMVSKNGVYYMKTAQERDLEKRVKERRRELMESYRAQKEERRETVASTHITNTETKRSIDRGEERSAALESRRREERDVMEGRVGVSQVSNGLHSTPAPEQQSYPEQRDDRSVKRTPSFRLNAGKRQENLALDPIFVSCKKRRKMNVSRKQTGLFLLCRWSYTLTNV